MKLTRSTKAVRFEQSMTSQKQSQGCKLGGERAGRGGRPQSRSREGKLCGSW